MGDSHELAVVHDFFSIRGGGERVALTMAQAWQAALVYGYWTEESYDREEELAGLRVHDLHARLEMHGLRIVRLAHAFRFRTGFLEDYRRVIYSGDMAPMAAFQRDRGNLYYCHTPPRLVYDQREHHLARLPPWQRPMLRLLVRTLDKIYRELLPRMNLIVANSDNVRQRIRHYWGRDAEVVHPPCDTHRFRWIEQGDYYLSTARLAPLKRVELLVEAFRRMPDKKLVVASGGDQLPRLRALADGADNIHFTGWLDNAAMERWMGGALATLYAPRDEDFGMSPIESMAAGKPVIGVAEGGLLETVQHEQNGWLMPPEGGVEEVMAAVAWMSPARALAMRRACEVQAARFDRTAFLEKMRALLERIG